MELIAKERDRVLQRTARAYGLGFTIVAAACYALPGAVDDVMSAVLGLLGLAVVAIAQYVIGISRNPLWVLIALGAGVGVLAAATGLGETALGDGGVTALQLLLSGSLASTAIVLAGTAWRLLGTTSALIVVAAASLWMLDASQPPLRTGGLLLLGWLLAAGIGAWISAGIPQIAKRIGSIGRAHRAERQASELEAQRRQSARLLHDTVLATLTLLAHSGVGVTPEALRQQASEDARLLRQLRLGSTPTPEASGSYRLGAATAPGEEPVLGRTLESVKQRFGRMGLTVSWHGTGQVLLPSDVLDAFLLALAECLENVRRHSGVTEAHVTITEDDTTVRAMVTDAGVGFDIADIDEAKLGFAESVVARLRDIGGNARLFSSPGSGTTVVLEVPR
ncbi:ATP-binding protein [Homoserinibacter sp. GY 40078]|uniref:ATP-binding protein n=1 Tax=Homoserinibacter sp. GY 40078 TaxID=2603275 RepID=UPI0011CB5A39|nr:ATP-binding protein [Homoserinibacter sp. GY 40078]TXK17219.1 histidine kinase [Homoserinibacter sp. GY 40078]